MKVFSVLPSWKEAISFVLEFIERGLPEGFSYHSVAHTRSVLAVAETLSESEGLDPVSKTLLLVAAAWHDSGYLVNIHGHEQESCSLARKHLPGFGFSADQVDEICRIIMATKISNEPSGLLQEIICDADLQYLGTGDYQKIAGLLYEELLHFGLIDNKIHWIDMQIAFLSYHRYYTRTAILLYEKQKNLNLQRLIALKH